jgi:hypothetical protein
MTTIDVIAHEGYENVESTGDDLHAEYFEGSRVESAHETIYEFKRVHDTSALYGRLEGNEDWHYMFTVEEA